MSGRARFGVLGLLVALLVVGGTFGLYLLQGRAASAVLGERVARAEAARLAAELQAARAGSGEPEGSAAGGAKREPEIAEEVPESEYPRIIADLVKHPELIPAKPVLGGRMFFLEDEVRVLGPKWVVAPFEDGHVAGVALLRYRLGSSGEVRWELIDSYLL
ncbi:MAG: hypothetical protein ACK47B_13940 [Armatimonadota bacterium]